MYEQIASNKRKSILMTIMFLAMALGLGWVFGQLMDIGNAGILVAFVISGLMAVFSYYSGDQLALWTSGARPITKEENAYLYRIVENLCIASGLPMPKIYVIEDAAPNAFATGRDPKHSSIAVTTGLMASLQNEELEGVIAHELSHIKNYDIRVMTMIIVMAGAVALLSDWFLRSLWWRGGRDRDRSGNAVLFLVGIVLALLSPLIGKIIQLAVSRRREFLADASGALLTRYPEGLASALEKIAAYKMPLQRVHNATAHLYISNPFGPTKRLWSNLFSTHPPIEERVKILRNLR